MNTPENDHYSYHIIWSEEDDGYLGLCVELPGLSWLAATPEEALKGIRGVVAEVIKDMKMNGDPIPQPNTSKPG